MEDKNEIFSGQHQIVEAGVAGADTVTAAFEAYPESFESPPDSLGTQKVRRILEGNAIRNDSTAKASCWDLK